MLLRRLIGVLLLVHGAVHCILAAAPNPNATDASVATFFSGWAAPWLRSMFSSRTLQIIAILLAAIAGVGFLAAGLAMFGWLLPHDCWRMLAVASSVASLVLCGLYWNTYLIVGPVVAIGILLALGVLHWPGEAVLGH